MLDEGLASKRGTEDLDTLLAGGQGPGASPDCVPAGHLEVSDVRRFLTSGVPDARFPGIELYARLAPQGLLHGGVHCRSALGGRDDVSVVQKGKNGFAIPQMGCRGF